MFKRSRLVILGIFFFCLQAGRVNAEVPTSWVPGQYIVKYNAEGIEELRDNPQLAQYSAEVIEEALTEILAANTVENLPLIEANTIVADDKNELDVNTAVDLIDLELIEYITPDFIRKTSAVPNDAMYSSLWGMNQTSDLDINGPEAADKASFSDTGDIIVGVIDTGVDYNHPDLRENMWTNPLELNGSPGVDDDGNGIVDDIHGYNAINNSGDPFDDNRHGTYCAGTIGAKGNNGIGVAGVVWNVKLMALKFLDAEGSGADSNAIKAINYAVTMRNRGGKLRVLNNSWGGGGYNPALLNAIKVASDAGILFVAAAGNENTNTDVSNNYPSGYDSSNVLAVAAINTDGTRASFSNYGANTVDLAAPGVNILSTVPGNRYESLNGTSMATPHVSGLAVLVYSQTSEISAGEVKDLLMQSIKPSNSLNGLMLKAGIPDAAILASNHLNHAPELQTIGRQFINPQTRKLAVPLVAFDKDKQPLTFKAEMDSSSVHSQVIELDKLYGFYNYYTSVLDYYWKLILGNNNRQFYIRYDGILFEKQGSGYSQIASVGVQYFENPYLLMDAYDENKKIPIEINVTPGHPHYVDIIALENFTDIITITATASDGEKNDSEQFTVEMKNKEACQ